MVLKSGNSILVEGRFDSDDRLSFENTKRRLKLSINSQIGKFASFQVVKRLRIKIEKGKIDPKMRSSLWKPRSNTLRRRTRRENAQSMVLQSSDDDDE